MIIGVFNWYYVFDFNIDFNILFAYKSSIYKKQMPTNYLEVGVRNRVHLPKYGRFF
jgi:hypothetical protein